MKPPLSGPQFSHLRNKGGDLHPCSHILGVPESTPGSPDYSIGWNSLLFRVYRAALKMELWLPSELESWVDTMSSASHSAGPWVNTVGFIIMQVVGGATNPETSAIEKTL